MNRIVTIALVGCTGLSAVGAFGGPLLCSGRGPECADRWGAAAGDALKAAALLGTLLATCPGRANP
jgi:hypothetical protein